MNQYISCNASVAFDFLLQIINKKKLQSRALSASEVTCECKANASSLVKYSTAAPAIAMPKRLKSVLQAVIFQSIAASC